MQRLGNVVTQLIIAEHGRIIVAGFLEFDTATPPIQGRQHFQSSFEQALSQWLTQGSLGGLGILVEKLQVLAEIKDEEIFLVLPWAKHSAPTFLHQRYKSDPLQALK